MKQKLPDQESKQLPGWSGRILILAVAGILFLTLFPFRFVFHTEPRGILSPFLLQSGIKSAGALDDFLNVLLFVPFGFGLAGMLRDRGMRRIKSLASCLFAGALLSYGVEFLQNYIPNRDSGWHDVFTNSTGAIVGCLLFEFAGRYTVHLLSAAEKFATNYLTWQRSIWIIALYFAAWVIFSIPLQQHARIWNWDSNALLSVGNFSSGRLDTAWRGSIYRLDFYDRSIPENVAEKMTAENSSESTSTGLVATYDFSVVPPVKDGTGHLPNLDWISSTSSPPTVNPIVLDGKSRLVSASPIGLLAKNFTETNQFSLRLICAAANVSEMAGRIVTISRGSGTIDLDVKQEGADLVFWFRNRLSARRWILPWNVPGVFQKNQVRDILLSFDGAHLSLYIDGRKDSHAYLLGPAAVLAHFFRSIKTSELEGYNYVYYALIFFLGGALIGISIRNPSTRAIQCYFLLGAGFILPAVVLELVLMHVAGRAISFSNIILSISLVAGGSLWVNTDI